MRIYRGVCSQTLLKEKVNKCFKGIGLKSIFMNFL